MLISRPNSVAPENQQDDEGGKRGPPAGAERATPFDGGRDRQQQNDKVEGELRHGPNEDRRPDVVERHAEI